jgi:hypothetical protein
VINNCNFLFIRSSQIELLSKIKYSFWYIDILLIWKIFSITIIFSDRIILLFVIRENLFHLTKQEWWWMMNSHHFWCNIIWIKFC